MLQNSAGFELWAVDPQLGLCIVVEWLQGTSAHRMFVGMTSGQVNPWEGFPPSGIHKKQEANENVSKEVITSGVHCGGYVHSISQAPWMNTELNLTLGTNSQLHSVWDPSQRTSIYSFLGVWQRAKNSSVEMWVVCLWKLVGILASLGLFVLPKLWLLRLHWFITIFL